MFEFLSQNRLVATGLLLIAGYGISAFADWDSEDDAFAPNGAISAAPSPDAIADEEELAAHSRRAAAPPSPPAEFYEEPAENADDMSLIDDAAGFDPSPEFDDFTATPDPSSPAISASSGEMRSNAGSADGADMSILAGDGEIEAEYN
ncbi:hypothetical protein [Pontixanthobacter sp.]|uniref:hypothetical protein n=1 Tax=Pontixanthobacter sp. TaxID=2792078 RepID=UPI003C7E19E9